MRVDKEKMAALLKEKGIEIVSTVICANMECKHYDKDAVMKMYPMSVYCSLECKYNDPDSTHKETYGD